MRDAIRGDQPKDIDAFVLGVDERNRMAVVADIVDRANKVWPASPTNTPEPLLVGTWWVYGVGNCQIITTPCASVGELLATFDWNISVFAFDGSVHGHIPDARPEELQLATVTYPRSTLRRGINFSQRFGLKIKDADYVRLCRLAASDTHGDEAGLV